MPHKRKYYSGRDVRRAFSIDELRAMARRRVPNFAFEYLEGGAERELTMRSNRMALDAVRFKPRTLVDTSGRQQKISLFGRELSSPLIIAPSGLNGMLAHRADVALAKAAANAGIPFTLSTVSNVALEDVAAEAPGRLWMQLYLFKDRGIAEKLIERASQAGYEALVFTADANVFGNREWDRRNYRRLGKLTLRNMIDALGHPRWLLDVMVPHGPPTFANIAGYLSEELRRGGNDAISIPRLFAPNISWDDVAWLRRSWSGKLLLKGVLDIEDARRAAAMGCDGIVVSNHGGRQLDACIASVEALPAIVQAVADRLAVIVDSGFRRGVDVVKALALGAHAVMLGRATLYGVAAGGEGGARHAISLLTSEIDRTLGLLGCRSVDELSADFLSR